MKTKRLFLGALLIVSTTAFGVITEVGNIEKAAGDSITATATGSAELSLESTGTVMDVTSGTLYLELKPEANAQGDADKLNFNFDNVIVGNVAERNAKFEARMYVGTVGQEPEDPINFDKFAKVKFKDVDGNGIKVSLIDPQGKETENGEGTTASFVTPVMNERGNIMGGLKYAIAGDGSLVDSDYAYQGVVKATLYTEGSNMPTDVDTVLTGEDNEIVPGATGTFTAVGGKVKFAINGMNVADDPNVIKVAGELPETGQP